jgi:hypothetical protein
LPQGESFSGRCRSVSAPERRRRVGAIRGRSRPRWPLRRSRSSTTVERRGGW